SPAKHSVPSSSTINISIANPPVSTSSNTNFSPVKPPRIPPFDPESWSIDIVLDQSYFLEKLPQQKSTFQSSDDYYGHFVYLVLEETRAEIENSLNNIGDTQPLEFEVVSVYKNSLWLASSWSLDDPFLINGHFVMITPNPVS